jgi:CRP/FNR family transcriptional regulator, dissimilatory nitrate respiration regulator
MDTRATTSAAALRDQRLVMGVLAHLPLLAGVGTGEVEAIAKRAWLLAGRRGGLIAGRQTPLPGMFAVAYGIVRLVLGGPEGERRVLRLVTAGETFGEASALLGRPVDYEALAVRDSKLVVVPVAAISECADRDARFARNLMNLLAKRTVELVAELQAATLQGGRQRLARYLETLAAERGPSGPLRIELPVSKTVIASRLGVKKETLSRLLRQLSAEGVIQVGRRDIGILDRERLAALVAPAVDMDQIPNPAPGPIIPDNGV